MQWESMAQVGAKVCHFLGYIQRQGQGWEPPACPGQSGAVISFSFFLNIYNFIFLYIYI